MTDVPSEDGQVELESFRHAVHGLYLASLPPEALAILDELGDVDPGLSADDAANELASLRCVDRWLKLHAVASSVNRNPNLVAPRTTSTALAAAIAPEGPDPRSVDSLADGLEQFAAELPGPGPGDRQGLTPRRWVRFLGAIDEPIDEPGGSDQPEPGAGGPGRRRRARAVRLVNKPGCNDEEIVPTPTGNAATIRSRFWTTLPLGEAAAFVDPERWPACGRPFWRQMAMVDQTKVELTSARGQGYTATFEEIVDLPVVGPVTVHLRVRYVVGEDYVAVEYRRAGPADPGQRVVFDSGWMYATRLTMGEHGERTYVDGLKSIRFGGPWEKLNQVPDLVCDGGWVYLMINMALRCAGLPVGTSVPPATVPASAASAATAAGPGAPRREVVANLGQVVDDWVAATTKVLGGQGAAVKSAVGRALAPRPDPRWVNDLVGMGHGAVAATRATLTAWRRALDELTRLGEDDER